MFHYTEFYNILEPEETAEGTVHHLDPYDYSKGVSEFIKTLNKNNFVQFYNWTAWQDQAKKYVDNPDLIEEVDLDIIHKLFTTHVRADRFSSGHFGKMIDDGQILKLLKQLQKISIEKSNDNN